MGDLRFVFAAIAVFAAAFVGMSFGMPWASKGFSVAAVNSTPSRLNAACPAGRAACRLSRHAPSRLPRTAADPRAFCHACSICGASCTARSRRSAHRRERPSRPDRAPGRPSLCARAVRPDGQDRCSSSRLRPTCAPRTSRSQAPKDARVHDAIKTAFQTGHVSTDEFPPDLMISGRFAPAPPSRVSCVNSAGLRP